MTPDTVAEPRALPLLPITAGVVAPGMVVNLALETPEARLPVEAALAGDRRLVLVPRVDGRYSTVGTVAAVESVEPAGRRGPCRRRARRRPSGDRQRRLRER